MGKVIVRRNFPTMPKQDHQLALSNYPHQPEANKSSLDNISLVSESVVRVDNDRSWFW